jgi:hypothetical protein
LRKNGEAQPRSSPALEKAVAADAPPRLRTAALPIYARLIDPAEVETLATAATKGPPAGRVTAAALWGVVAIKQPDTASKPLKVFLYDQSPDVRAEAARAFGYLKREGTRAGAQGLGRPQPRGCPRRHRIGGSLGRLATRAGRGRSGTRHGQGAAGHAQGHRRGPGTDRTDPAGRGLPPLAKALKQGEIPTRISAARAFCEMAKKAPWRRRPICASPRATTIARFAPRRPRASAA